ncbi:hypothetical protein V2H45_13825 [Tumidithrix elongata RA019]|uniref:Thiamine-binding protein domain-containing protein n=1 Tax=Tumidithrix elongata BACA0141 TaxID=2716417 RepID=A0AAW9Q5C8_9CYAN|nr:hypothetical protein [Tumidithrix elongata RA019]
MCRPDTADRLQKAVENVIGKGTHVTYELASADVTSVGKQEMAEAIAAKLTKS